MRRWPIGVGGIAAACALAAIAPARAGTSVDIQLHVGDRYPGADVVFHSEPDVVMVPSTRVYYVRNYNYDLYRYQNYWFYCDGLNWYRGRSNRGPFLHIHYSNVPRAVYSVPRQYRHHWRDWPPGREYGHYRADRHAAARYHRHDTRHEVHREQHDDRDHDNREAHRDDGHSGK